ncbi:bifunctional GTP diphosphokinase/guanosine-3',5'-bis pyrophosphate 3'-pyrophosphohydrolase [Halomonas sp. McH1-25]|uniref:bifunctional GTP diphosphokinase/guanosine-3',5'-bis pyrophosphate 3'-pyrophosphohydrolase n=1 Tax=unclassified Halomonas TaxID=2609666 RepID=UPI001EF4F4E1|nr:MULTISPECIES: bifunctional GTP diphosphokinase/guanosine-3',5'-bis pyrophosphate 3'-pyrophosphohydrolase [unclassified Halomonas]MCG7599696.1 bifunctional GTP diphosphokinase/guanosine-3',5'-bis pyrophosphate 3'-pyrophosphohydrolase [Halomonas sp. McH1-25]MCP1342780.1 bifunctional GTP diphosphokinase/guanosine-3',5'-bis pyrophosphate 3'-pyrophosphohydrolase [Halomonas sp. FL8]MCP1360850.1 bifunctional GTP diphosphokinase/guanosine-3',5'-bis pyrophosphate 3'-pyrophosphohydrolase [Halomonas sp.
MFTIDDLADRLAGYLPQDEIQQVKRAFYYAEQAHDGQRRRSGEPYVTHPLAVSNILANMHMDHQSLMAAMLHDVIEDTGVSKAALAKQFGEPVAELVDGVSKLTQITFEDKAVAQAENFQKMVMAMSQDIRVIIVKLADRLHNMRTLGALRPDKKRRIARETLEIYARIAGRLGINTIRVELEDLSFQAIHPMRAERIKRAVSKARGNRRTMIRQVQTSLQNCLDDDGLPGTVVGRQKHLLSIYRKMHDQRKPFAEIMDVFGFRIITEDVDTCYRILGAVHNLYKPVPGRFKDYIAIPKANGYQSLHTTLFGANGMPIEVQIRTREMEAMANNGIAAHWLYKAGQTERPIAAGSHARAREWVRGLLEMQRHAGNPLEFIEHVKNDLFPDDIYVFTPKGDIMELPQGATAVDFAYTVHTDIGNSCIACRIDRHLAPLSTRLESGQTLEIITAPGARPNLAWLSFVVTAKARSAIRHALKNQQRTESIQLGRRLLNKALADYETSLEELPGERLPRVLEEFDLKHADDLMESIGLGTRMAYAVARRLTESQPSGMLSGDINGPMEGPVVISGTEGMVISFARCCHPLPGDPVVGHLSVGKGIVVHRIDCRNLEELKRDDPDKLFALEWSTEISGDFPVALRIEMETRRGLVAELASLVTDADANIERIGIEERDVRLSIVNLTLAVRDRVHLARIIKRIRNLPHVGKIHRVRN